MNKLMRKLDEHFGNVPESVAVTDTKNGERMTYSALDEFSGRVYSYLKKQSISKNDTVLIKIPRSVYSVAVLIGTWKSGACAALFDESYPENYMEHIISDCAPKLIFDSECLEEVKSEPYLSFREAVEEMQYAFICYTSGSTGKPKGIRHYFRSIDAIIEGFEESMKNTDVFAYTSSINFMVFDMFICPTLYRGKEYVLVDEISRKNINLLSEIFRTYNVTTAFFLPSQLRRFPSLADNLKTVFVGGEKATELYIDGIELYNLYSQSETGFPVVFKIDRQYKNTPIANIHETKLIHIEYDNEERTQGEVYMNIGFDNEYINLPEKSAGAFVNKMFRTGDIASVDENGFVYIEGRNDDMFKINGNRVESNAISEICRKVLNLDSAFAYFRTVEGRKAIVLYYISEKGTVLDNSCYDILSENMPSYMIPYYFIKMDSFPRLATGKIDRMPLPLPETAKKTDGGNITPLEKEICEAMRSALGIESVFVNDDFFNIGGDSLGSMDVIAKLGRYNLDMQTVIRGRTPRKIAEMLLSAKSAEIEKTDGECRRKGVLLNAFQTDMLDYQLQTPSTSLINVPIVLKFPKNKIDLTRLIDSVYKLIDTHPVFRTKISFDEKKECFLQRYYENAEYIINIVDITETELKKLLPTLDKPFRVFDELLYRFTVYKTEESIYLFADFSHLIFDGTSIGILVGNLEKLYLGKEVTKDYYYFNMLEREQNTESDSYKADKEYYDSLFGTKEYIHTLKPTRESNDNRVALIECGISDRWDALLGHIEKCGISENVFIIALSLLALYRYEKSENVMISWVYNGRKNQYIMNSIGEYITSLPVGVSITDSYTFGELYDEIKKQLIGGIAHDSYSYVFGSHRIALNDFIRVIDEGELLSLKGSGEFPFEALDVEYENQAVDTFAVIKILGGDIRKLGFAYMNSRFEESDMKDFFALLCDIFGRMISSDSPDVISDVI